MNTSPTLAPQWPIYLAEARCELLRVVRTPAFVVPSLAFPLVFYLMFGVLLGHGQGALPLLASYTVFGAMAPGLFGFGVGLALDRERGLLTLKRALPTPPAAWLLARVAMATVFALAIAALLLAAGMLCGGVRMPPTQAAALLAVAVFAAWPFCGIGLLVGSFVPANAAPAVVNLVYLPMSLLSGLWMPLSVLPPVFSALAPLWPAWHLGQLARLAVGLPAQGAAWTHVAVPLAIAALCLALAQRRLRRE
ncbi:ABC transporter permease [Stenotrophomonas sp. HITSZ_GD]|uniref:ABC transporter permease n=1 Tax=Stenotrophomonas sp. HITSZ_GD TaxID=3037248 RepID=UPI00240D8FD9|nr:ABC transporter permease [Stenotrophomonas sp. HITSZ_GD]MDG2523776.1 ABC transporter permease [Stenotrophomonas sp. HITSZ_GD]